MYRRTQTNRWLPILTIPAFVVAIWVTRTTARGATLAVVLVSAVILVVTTLVFSSLTVEVADGELRFHFGFGVWKKRVPVGEIARLAATRSVWWEGLGIRVTPRGWLYTVSGGSALEVTPRGKPAFRIGTPEPEVVMAAVDAARETASRP